MGTATCEKNGTSYLVGLALVLIAICPAMALAADVVVDGTVVVFGPDDVIDNLTVINGGTATLETGTVVSGDLRIDGQDSYANAPWGCTVVGNVTVKDGGELSMWVSTIGGNLHGIRSGHINFLISDVVGNVMIMEGEDFNAPYGPCNIGGNFLYRKGASVGLNWFTVGGNVNVSDNHGAYISIRNSTIANNVQVCNNVVVSDITITNNMIGNNLQARNNTPTATVTGNTVEGKEKVD